MTAGTYTHSHFKCSPIGSLRLVAEGGLLRAVHMLDGDDDDPPPLGAPCDDEPVLRQARRELEEYFAGARRHFEVPHLAEGTAFQRAVWSALSTIAYGAICSYADVARVVGRPTATRAVGAANGKNPLAIVVPCHRVIGSDRSLTGYGGGLGRKRWLLAHEAAVVGLVLR